MSTTTKKRLSYSGQEKYLTCPRMYKNYYVDELESERTTSALIFGSAMDLGLNALLAAQGLSVAKRAFKTELTRLISVPVDFHAADFDIEIIDIKHQAQLLRNAKNVGYNGDCLSSLMSALSAKIKNNGALSANQYYVLKLACWRSLRAKGLLMLEAYERQVLPLFEKIEAIQVPCKRGIADFVAILKDGTRVTGDNKTTSRPYKDDATRTSAQFASYDAPMAVYVTMNKVIKKNRIKTCTSCGYVGRSTHQTCNAVVPPIERGKPDPVVRFRCGGAWSETIDPEVVIQVIVDEVPEAFRKEVDARFEASEKAIEASIFPENRDACAKYYGKPCPYFNYCRTGSTEGLKKKERRS